MGRAQLSGEAPYRRLAAGGWGLPRGQRPPLETFAQALPTHRLVMHFVGDLLRWGGLGVCDDGPAAAIQVMAVAWALRRIRLDAIVHVVRECRTWGGPAHGEAVMQALGGLPQAEHMLVLDAAQWVRS